MLIFMRFPAVSATSPSQTSKLGALQKQAVEKYTFLDPYKAIWVPPPTWHCTGTALHKSKFKSG
jgi:hypothetical protein